EACEIFDAPEARTYIDGCDFPQTSDYAIVASEIAREFGNSGRISGHIVEVCPGPGNLCGELLTVGAQKVTGVDGSPVMLAHARKKFQEQIAASEMGFREGLAQRLPLADHSVDGIVNFNSFHQFADDQRAIEALREMARVLKPGGWGLVRDFKRGASQDAIDTRLEKTKPEIVPLLLASLQAAFTADEFREFLCQIPGIEFSVVDTENPWRLSEAVCEQMRNDPVAHWMDFLISQHVTIKKL
ncbi:MAG: class I SAM-dependent methyltransferase, partial [Patescibacteria group bacterium]